MSALPSMGNSGLSVRGEVVSTNVRRWIQRERAVGKTMAAIATSLKASRVADAHGGLRWYPSTVRAVLLAQRTDRVAHESR